MFCALLGQVSGERLQDQWSSGLVSQLCLYLGNSQVSVYRTIGPLVIGFASFAVIFEVVLLFKHLF